MRLVEAGSTETTTKTPSTVGEPLDLAALNKGAVADVHALQTAPLELQSQQKFVPQRSVIESFFSSFFSSQPVAAGSDG
jgi:hypothetical protein